MIQAAFLREYDFSEIHTAAPYNQIYPAVDHPDTGVFGDVDLGAFASRRIVISKAVKENYTMALERDLYVGGPIRYKE